MSVENPSLRDCPDKDFVLEVPHNSLQERIITLGLEYDNELFLMLRLGDWGERHRVKLANHISEGLFEEPSLREALFPESIKSKKDVVSFLDGASVRAKLINDYIKLTIASQLEKATERKNNYVQGIVRRKLRDIAIRRLSVMKLAINAARGVLTPDLEKERDRILKNIDFAPTIKSEILDEMKAASCMPLFRYFLGQKGIPKVEEELDFLCKEALKDKENDNYVVSELITNLLARIQEVRKKLKIKVEQPRSETKKLAFKATELRFEVEKKEVLEKSSEGEVVGGKSKVGRKRRPTAQGYLVQPKPDGIPLMDVDEFLEEDIEVDVKPTPAVMEAPAPKGPDTDIKPFRIPTPPPPVPLGERFKKKNPELSGPIPASKVFDVIEQRDQSGQIEIPGRPEDKEELGVLNFDYEPDTVVVEIPINPGHKNVMAPIPGALMAEDVLAAQEDKGEPAHPAALPPLPPKPASDELDENEDEKGKGGFDLGPYVRIVEENEKEERAKEEPEPATIDKVSKWFQRHMVKIGLFVGIASIGTAGYVIYQRQKNTSNNKGSKELKVAHNTQKDGDRRIAEPPMRSLDEPMTPKKVEPAMKAAPVMKVVVKKFAAKPKVAPKPLVTPKPTLAPKPTVTPPQKTVNVKGVSSTDKTTLVSIDKKTISDLPDSVYKDIWNGKAFDIQNAPHSSVTGFMEQQLKEMIKNLPTKKAQRKAMRAYNSTLKQLERGWLIYMSELEGKLLKKSMDGTITPDEDEKLKWWEEYKKSNTKRKWQAKWLHNKYQKLKDKKSSSANYYKNIYAMGQGMMVDFEKINPGVDPNNVPVGKKMRFVSVDGKAIGILYTFTGNMGLQTPEKGTGSTGELAPNKKKERKEMVAEVIEVDDDMVEGSYTVPPIPADAQVHSIDNSDMFDVVPMYGYQDAHMPPPTIPAHIRNHKPLEGKTSSNDVYAEFSLERLDVGDYEDFSVTEEEVIAPITLSSKIPVPKRELKPVLADMVKTSHNDAYAEYTIEDPNGEYDTYSVENKPVKETPPPIPAMAEVEKVEEPKKKKSLWGKAKGWLKSKVA